MNNKNHHYMGIEMNNQTWSLLDKKDRSEQDDIRMINYAKASLYHWRKSDKYTIVNKKRGKWFEHGVEFGPNCLVTRQLIYK